MTKREAEQAMKQILRSGYGHYSRAYERHVITAFLRGSELPFAEGAILDFPLADQPLRSIKNSLICAVAVICRYAADLGADDERCYALSDYYINEIEAKLDISNWQDFMNKIAGHYSELVQKGREDRYSLTIRRAIRYIGQHIYEPCTLKDVASALKLHPSYLSAQFKTETELPLTKYVQDKKMEEARILLRDGGKSVSEIAEMLGYHSVSYFSKVFHKHVLLCPRDYAAGRDLAE